MEICRLLSLVACANRVGGTKRGQRYDIGYLAISAGFSSFCANPFGSATKKLDSSTTLVAALPCRLDISCDNSNCLGYIGLRAACTLQSAASK